jgi:hypothetical protein
MWLQLKCYRKQVSSIGCSSKRAENQLHQLTAAGLFEFVIKRIDCAIYLVLKVAADVWGRQQARSPPAGVLTLSGAALEWALTTSAESMKPMASKCHLIYARGDSVDTFGDK